MRKLVSIGTLCASVLLFTCLSGCVGDWEQSQVSLSSRQVVGRVGANRYQTPTGQVLTPAGQQVELPGMRPQALALSPDGRLLAAAGKTNSLVLIDPANGQVLQTVRLSTGTSNAVKAEMSLTGLVFSPEGDRIYLSNAGGSVWSFPVDDLSHVGPAEVLAVPDANAPKQRHEIPTGLAVSADGKRLYVAGNLGNRLHELDAQSGKVLRSWDTGVAPFDVVLAGGKAYVSNLGGRRPGSGDLTAPAGQRHDRAGGPGAAHRQRRLGHGHRPGRGQGEDRNPGRAARLGAGGFSRTANTWWSPTPAATR